MALSFAGQKTFSWKVRNFPDEVYAFRDSDHLTKLMKVLLEDSGVGQLKKFQMIARLTQSLYSTNFHDLDDFFGAYLRLPRRADEVYVYNPFYDQLTTDEWNEILLKDAMYRSRVSMMLQSLLRGGTAEGIMMLAEAVTGRPCQVFEMWRSPEDIGLLEIGRLNASKEFTIVPQLESNETLPRDVVRTLYEAIDLLRPVNTLSYINQTPLAIYIRMPIKHAVSPSEFWEVKTFVTAPTSLAPTPDTGVEVDLNAKDGSKKRKRGKNDPTLTGRPPWRPSRWLNSEYEKEGRAFAYKRKQARAWHLNDSVSAVSTYHFTPENINYEIGRLKRGISSRSSKALIEEFVESASAAISSQPQYGFIIRIDDEILLVRARKPASLNSYTYTVRRASNSLLSRFGRTYNTIRAKHSAGAKVYIAYTPIAAPVQPISQDWSQWQAFELADSPDNFPAGKYPGDQSRYSTAGDYLFTWDSQAQFVEWQTRQITANGGEVIGDLYRYPASSEFAPGPGSNPADSLASIDLEVSATFFPRPSDGGD